MLLEMSDSWDSEHVTHSVKQQDVEDIVSTASARILNEQELLLRKAIENHMCLNACKLPAAD